MPKNIHIKKGFDINIKGKPLDKIKTIEQSSVFAIKPSNFYGLTSPKLLVKVGDNVKAGSPIFYEKSDETIIFSSPVSGEVIEINRVEKRRITDIKILADKTIDFEAFKKYSLVEINNLPKEEAITQLKQSGTWVNIIERPYGVLANSEKQPKSIFISGFDSSPLAPNYAFTLKEEKGNFEAGIKILKKLTKGKVYLGVNAAESTPPIFKDADCETIKFFGPHPSGNVGVHIHHTDAINKGETVWTVNPQGVVQIGKLFMHGKYDASKLIAVAGPQIQEPCYVRTYAGAQLDSLVKGNTEGDSNRYISGNVLTGENVGEKGFLNLFDNMITVLNEERHEEFLGWIMPEISKPSFYKAFGILSHLNKGKEFSPNTKENGEQRNFVLTGEFEKVMPMDILPTYLFKSILAKDYDEMEALGIYELIEEDVALCEFIDVSKNPLQKIIREGIDLISKD